MVINQSSVIGVVLAGGAGSRLNGADKGLLLYQGKRLVEHVVERLHPQVDDILICANRNIEQYASLGFMVIQDKPVRDVNRVKSKQERVFQGPMAGISAALKTLNGEQFSKVAVVSCDVPNLPSDLVNKLNNDSNNPVSVAHDGRRRQNLHCLIDRSVWGSLIDAFENGERAMHRWYASVGCDEIDFSLKKEAFLNINSNDRLESSS